MKKRILCLLLCMVMMIGVLASCGAKDDSEAVEDINEKASESAITLAMYLMSETEVSEAQVTAIEEAVNKITNADKIKLELFYYTPDKYYEALEKAFADRKAAEEQGLVTKPSDESVEDQTYEDDWGITRIEYPTIDSYQVDIFYMGGYAKFAQYLEMGMLQDWNTELKGASKLNHDYIFPQYMTYMQSLNNGIYALPTNKAIGEYTYMLINNDLATKHHYNTVEGLKSFTSPTSDATQDFLRLVKESDTDYVPIYSALAQYELASTGVHYWGTDENGNLSNDFSLLASNYNVNASYKSKDSYMENIGLVLDTNFISQLRTIKEYDANGYFGTADDLKNGKAAVAFMKGGAEIPTMYSENYTAVVIDYPQITTQDIFSDMFAVTTYSANASRSMEIVTKLNTDETFRNLILYGISKDEAPEGVEPNYEWVDSDYLDANGKPYKVVRRLNENYMMDINKTGNTLIAACTEDENPALREFVKDQNNDVKTSVLMGFRLGYNNNNVDPAQFDTLRAVSAQALELLESCSAAELNATITTIREMCTNGEAKVVYDLSYNYMPAEGDEFCTFGYLYNVWATDMGIAPDEQED